MSRQRRRFDSEFRDGAVRIVKETGRPVAHVRDRRRWQGSWVICWAMASRTAWARWPAGAGPVLVRGALLWPSVGGRCSSIA